MPVKQEPPQQICPLGQGWAPEQAVQVWLTQTGAGLAQSVLVQQFPARHWPEQQTCPPPHCALLAQAAQVWSTQSGVAPLQSSSVQQVPLTQPSAQQRLPSPAAAHSPAPEQVAQAWSWQSGVGLAQAVQASPPAPQAPFASPEWHVSPAQQPVQVATQVGEGSSAQRPSAPFTKPLQQRLRFLLVGCPVWAHFFLCFLRFLRCAPARSRLR
jgi:hypothetical protein